MHTLDTKKFFSRNNQGNFLGPTLESIDATPTHLRDETLLVAGGVVLLQPLRLSDVHHLVHERLHNIRGCSTITIGCMKAVGEGLNLGFPTKLSFTSGAILPVERTWLAHPCPCLAQAI